MKKRTYFYVSGPANGRIEVVDEANDEIEEGGGVAFSMEGPEPSFLRPNRLALYKQIGNLLVFEGVERE